MLKKLTHVVSNPLLIALLLLGVLSASSHAQQTPVLAWGSNSNGQLGNGTTIDSSTPIQVSGLTGVTSIAGGASYSLAIKKGGTAWAWGSNSNGQLGNGTTIDSSTPIQVSGLTGVTSIDGRSTHSLASKSDGTVWAWGNNSNGQLGDGTTTNSPTPVQVSSLTGATAVAAGNSHSLALKSDGTVWAWGINSSGQLGDGTTADSLTPVQVSGLTGVTSITAGSEHSLALKSDGTVWAWGFGGTGRLGDGTSTTRSTPVQVSGLTGVTSIAAGGFHSLAAKSDGTVWAWGLNLFRQLGDGSTSTRTTPVQVSGLTDVTSVAAGASHSLALKNDGTVWAWGGNNSGQLGTGNRSSVTSPVQVSGLKDVDVIDGGASHSLAAAVPNADPTASDGTATTEEDARKSITLTASDTNNDPLSYKITSLPTNGSLYEGNNAPTRRIAASELPYTLAGNGSIVTYEPNPNYNGSDSFKFKVNDGQDDSNEATISVTVTPVNDAPVLDDMGTMSLNAITEDDTTNNGTAVSDILASAGGERITDLDGPSKGIAIYAASSTNGMWQYSLDGGSVWTYFGTLSNSSARLLSASGTPSATRIRFVPNANYSGSVTPGIAFYAWDGSTGTNGSTANAQGGGGTSAFSSAFETASITVNAVNDPPRLNTPNGIGDGTVLEDAPDSVIDLTNAAFFVDDDGETLTFTVQSNTNTALVTTSVTGSTLTLDFQPNQHGVATIKVRATDAVGAYAEDSFTVTVTPVNDAPSFTKGPNIVVNQDSGAYSQAWATNISAGPANESTQTLTFNVSNNNNALFSVQPAVSGTGVLSFTPATGASGTASVTVQLRDNGGSGFPNRDFSDWQTFTITVYATNAFVVTTTNDTEANDGVTSLREAIKLANTNNDVNTITFDIPGAGPHTVQLGGVLDALNSSMNIVGPSEESVTIRGEGAADPYGIFSIAPNVSVTIEKLTIANGNSNLGGGISNNGVLTIKNSTISGNTSTTHAGGIYSSGMLTISNSTISGNTASVNGGGVFNVGGNATIRSSTISGNTAENSGGIWSGAAGATLTINNSIVTGNTATSNPNILGDFTGSNNLTSGNAKLGALADNGGPTFTMLPAADSPAINEGASDEDTDQRGISRPQGAVDDIGAVEVAGLNTPPKVTDISKTTNEDEEMTFAVKDFEDGFTDGDDDELASITITSLPTNGTLELDETEVEATDIILRTDIANLTYTPDANYNGPDSFGWNGSDGKASAAQGASVNITVAAVNDAPVVTLPSGNGTYTLGGPAILYDNAATVTDPDSADFNGGILTLQPRTGNFEDLYSIRSQGTEAGQIGVEGGNVTYGGVGIGTFVGGKGPNALVVTFNTNATPAAAQALLRNIIFNTPATATSNRQSELTISDGDGGTSSVVTKTIVIGAAPESSINIVKLTNGTDNNTAPGPSVPVGSTVTFTYQVTNAGDTALSGITVNDDNGTPANNGDDFNATFVGGDTNSNSLLDLTETWTFTASRIATPGQYTNIGTATGTPPSGPAVSDTDVDNHFGVVSNNPPIATDGSAETEEDTPIDLDLALLVSDDKTSDANLIYTIVSEPADDEGSVTIKGSVVTFTPAPNFAGEASFTYKVTDEGGLESAVKKVTITVASADDAPVLNPIGHKSVNELNLLSFTATASDGDDNVLTFSLQGAPSGASMTSNGVFSWTPTEAQGPGTYWFRVRVSDGTSSDEESISVTVNEVNTAPVLELGGNRTLTAGVPFSFGITAYDSDLPAQGGGVSLVNAPSWINVTGGPTIYGTPPVASAPYSVNLTVRAGDSFGAVTQKSIVLSVNVNPSRAAWTVEPSWSAGEGTLTYRLKNNTNSALTGVYVSGQMRVPVTGITKSVGSTSWNTQGNGYYGVYWSGFNLAAGAEATLVIKVPRPARGMPVAQTLYCSYGPGSQPTLVTTDVKAP